LISVITQYLWGNYQVFRQTRRKRIDNQKETKKKFQLLVGKEENGRTEERYIFKKPEEEHFQVAADSGLILSRWQPSVSPLC